MEVKGLLFTFSIKTKLTSVISNVDVSGKSEEMKRDQL